MRANSNYESTLEPPVELSYVCDRGVQIRNTSAWVWSGQAGLWNSNGDFRLWSDIGYRSSVQDAGNFSR